MHIPIEIVCLVLASVLALQGWALRQLDRLSVKVAVLETLLRNYHTDTQHFIKSHK